MMATVLTGRPCMAARATVWAGAANSRSPAISAAGRVGGAMLTKSIQRPCFMAIPVSWATRAAEKAESLEAIPSRTLMAFSVCWAIAYGANSEEVMDTVTSIVQRWRFTFLSQRTRVFMIYPSLYLSSVELAETADVAAPDL